MGLQLGNLLGRQISCLLPLQQKMELRRFFEFFCIENGVLKASAGNNLSASNHGNLGHTVVATWRQYLQGRRRRLPRR